MIRLPFARPRHEREEMERLHERIDKAVASMRETAPKLRAIIKEKQA